MAVRYNSYYISLPFSADNNNNNNVRLPNSALCREREPKKIILKIYISNLTPCSINSFEFSQREIH